MDGASRGQTPGIAEQARHRIVRFDPPGSDPRAGRGGPRSCSGVLGDRVLLAGHRRHRRICCRGAKPITEVIATTSDTALKNRLARAQKKIRAFASRELGFPTIEAIRAMRSRAAVRGVERVRRAELSLVPRQWCFPSPAASTTAAISRKRTRARKRRSSQAAGDDVPRVGHPGVLDARILRRSRCCRRSSATGKWISRD
jgi:hypothetical protein